MAFFRDLAALLRFSGFRRLFAVRLLSQGSDGIFQVALVSTVLFSPERAPTAGAIAVAFATILLPFTVLGPFVGVFLDRWLRWRILMASNAIRAILLLVIALLVVRDDVGGLFYLLVLAAFSVNRFLLAGLSASLPHVVSRELLVTANGVSPTCGTLAYLSGVAFGGAVHALSHSDGIVLVVGAVSYFLSALLAWRLPNLGPDLEGIDNAVREALGNVVRGLGDAARHLPPLGRLALGVVGAGQLPYGVMIVGTMLLFRNHFERSDVGAGLAGFGIVVGASGAGYAVAALVTSSMTKRFGMHGYVTVMSVLASLMMVFPAALFTRWAIVVSAFGLGIATQGVKICVDTTLQRVVGDVYRGRVFVLYDVLFNAVFVAAAVLAAIVIPTDGPSYVVLAMASLWYLLIAYTVSGAGRSCPDPGPGWQLARGGRGMTVQVRCRTRLAAAPPACELASQCAPHPAAGPSGSGPARRTCSSQLRTRLPWTQSVPSPPSALSSLSLVGHISSIPVTVRGRRSRRRLPACQGELGVAGTLFGKVPSAPSSP